MCSLPHTGMLQGAIDVACTAGVLCQGPATTPACSAHCPLAMPYSVMT